MKRALILIGTALVAWLASGLFFVQPDEQVVVCRFGQALSPPRGPGAHWGLPWGLDRLERIKPREVKRVTLGPLNLGGEAIGASESQFLTGDRNLVNVRATVQYSIRDPMLYLFGTRDADLLVAKIGDAALTSTLATQSVDRALTLGKQDLGVLARQQLQRLADVYGLGISVRSVDIGSVDPPAEVSEAFDSVISALRQRDQQIHQSQSYANRTLAQAEASAQRSRDLARADRDRFVRQAEGETRRFESVLKAYLQQPALTARRIYLETMAETLPRFRSKLIVDSGSDLDLSIIGQENR